MSTRNFNGRTKTPRTRSGCLTCRKRKVKCDEQQPACRRCSDADRQCEYGLKVCWLDERQNTRRSSPPVTYSVVATSHGPTRNVTHVFVNTTWDDFEPDREDLDVSSTETWDQDDPSLVLVTPQPEFSLSTLSISANFPDPHMPHMEMLLFDFYANRMCKKCALLDANRNTYRRVIVPISFHSQLVLQSCLAAAATQMTRLSSHYSQAALRYRGSCLKSLHRHIAYLSSGQIPTMVSTKTEILGAILMLCFFDYFNSSFQGSLAHRQQVGWKVHLDGARRILDLKTTTESPQCDQAVSSFLGHYLATHSVFSYTTLTDPSEGEALLRGGRYWLRRTVRPDSEINSFAGCSNELLMILLDIIARVRKAPINSQRSKSFGTDMLARLDSLVQYSPTTGEEQPSSPVVGQPLDVLILATPTTSPSESSFLSQRMNLAVSNAFRHAAIILCHYLIPSTTISSSPRIQQSVSIILSSLYTSFDDLVWPKLDQGHSIFLWPYFIAGCHAFQDEDRIVVATKFRTLRERGESLCRIVDPMLEIIERVWKQNDLETEIVGGRVGGDATSCVFTWERALKRRGWAFNWT